MRCYNGCPDDELAAILKSQADAHSRARELGYCITWFPVEQKYAAAKLETWESVGPYCHSAEQCLTHVEEHAGGTQ
jgi:hypothetical protein